MRRDDLTSMGFTTMFKRLCLGFRHTIPAEQLEGTIEVYFTNVRRFSEPVVASVVDLLLRGGGDARFFPKAPELFRLCLAAEEAEARRHGQQHHHDSFAGCPGCGREFWVAGYELGNGNVVGRLRCACRPQGQGWFTEAAKAWQPPAAVPTTAALEQLLLPPAPSAPGQRDLDDARARFRAAVKPAEPPPPDEPPDELDPLEEMEFAEGATAMTRSTTGF